MYLHRHEAARSHLNRFAYFLLIPVSLTACVDRATTGVTRTDGAVSLASRQAAEEFSRSEISDRRLGCLVMSTDTPTGRPTVIRHLEAAQLRLNRRSGILIPRTAPITESISITCFLNRNEDASAILERATFETRLAGSSTKLKARVAHQKRGTFRSDEVEAINWINSKLPVAWRQVSGSTNGVNLSMGDLPLCDMSSTFFVLGTCRWSIRGAATSQYLVLSQAELEWRLAGRPPESIMPEGAIPSFLDYEGMQCRWANDLFFEVGHQIEWIDEDARQIEQAFNESSYAGQMCENVLRTSNQQYCIDLFIAEKKILYGLGDGDGRGPDPQAPRASSRVQLNFDPVTLAFNVSVNGSTVNFFSWNHTFGDGGETWTDTSSGNRPSSIRQFSIKRVNGDPSYVEVSYAFENQANTATHTGALFPTIDGRLRMRRLGSEWSVDTDNTLLEMYPYFQLNKKNNVSGDFESVLTLPNSSNSTLAGLSVMRNATWIMNNQRYELMRRTSNCMIH